MCPAKAAPEPVLGAREVVCSALPADASHEPVELSIEQGRELLDFCQLVRIIPLVRTALAKGRIAVPDEVEALLRERHRHVMSTALRIEAALVEVGGMLDDEGVDFRVLKGLATGHIDYPSPSMRQIGDADLLIPNEHRELVERLLVDRGLSKRPERRLWESELEHATTYYLGDVEIDVHHRLLRRGPGHALRTIDFFAEPVFFPVGGRQFPALSRPHRYLHAAGHIVTSPGAMRRWSSYADALLLRIDCDVTGLPSPARDLIALAERRVAAIQGEPLPSLPDRSMMTWAYGGSERHLIREHLAEVFARGARTALRNQVSWITLPIQERTRRR